MNKLIRDLSIKFINLPIENFEDELPLVLADIGKYAKAARSYIFEFFDNQKFISNTYGWVDANVTLEKENLQNIEIDKELPYFSKIIKQKKNFIASDIDKLPKTAEKEKLHFKEQNIKALAVVPITTKNQLTGFVGFDFFIKDPALIQEGIEILDVVGNFISNIFERRNNEKQIQKLNQKLESQNLEAENTAQRQAILLKKLEREILEHKEDIALLSYFRDALKFSSDAIGFATPKGEHWYQNKSFDKLFGDIGKNPPASLYVDQEESKKIFSIIKAGGRWSGQVKMYSKNGSILDIHINAYPVKNKYGKITGLVGVHSDITEKKIKEQQLIESEQMLKTILETSPIGVGLVKNRYLDWANDSMYEIFGYSKGSLLGKSSEILYPDKKTYKETGKKLYENLKKTNYPKPIETKFKKSDGTIIHALISIKNIDNNDLSKGQIVAVSDISDKVQSRLLIEESEKKYRTYIESSPIGIFITDDNGNFIDINNGACLMTGYTKSELIKMDILKISPKDLQQKNSENFETLKINNKLETEMVLLRKNNSTINIYLTAVKIDDSKYIGFCSDITKRKKVEEDLKKSRKLFKELFNNMSTGGAIYKAVDNGKDFVFLDFNNTAEKIDKISKNKVIGKKVTEVFPAIKKFGLLDIFKHVYKTGESKHFPVSCYEDKRIIGWRENFVYKLSSGEIVSVYSDVTEKQKFLKQLEENEIKYRKLFNSVIDAIFITDFSGKILAVNKVACKTYGYKEEEFPDLSIKDIDLKFSLKEIQKNINKIKKNQVINFESEHIIKDGKHIFVEVTAKKIKYQDSYSILSLCRDITDRKNLQQQLVYSEKLSAVGQLAAGIAHEFNNILAIINMSQQYLELITSNTLDDESLGSIQTIKQAVKRGKSIVSNMMSFAKPKEAVKKSCNIEDIIETVLKLQKYQLEFENIIVKREYKKTGKVQIDPGQFEQVFLNLIINSRHAIKHKGKGCITITTKQKKENLIVCITDNGIGIDTKKIKNIFNPFFTTKGAKAKNDLAIEGTGLGLSITHSIIKNHNGSISVESQKEKGTSFIITLPIVSPKIINNKKKINSEALEFNNEKINLNILLIDDEKHILQEFKKILKQLNCSITSVDSGEKALEVIKSPKTKLDLIFLDLLIPDISGDKLIKKIKKIKPNIAIVLITGQIYPDKKNISNKNIYSLIQKPFDLKVIINILSDISKKKKNKKS